MDAIENMVNEEMVQDVVTVVEEIQPTIEAKSGFENVLYAIAGVLIWEGGKFVFKKAKAHMEAKKATAEIADVEPEIVDQDGNVIDIQ